MRDSEIRSFKRRWRMCCFLTTFSRFPAAAPCSSTSGFMVRTFARFVVDGAHAAMQAERKDNGR